MSFGGRLVILKFVLSNLPLYFFSFYKAPKNVIKKPINLQRNFLWTGETQPKKISWVAWDQICKPKHEGGSGVKCLEMFSLSLLSKWRWRLLNDKSAIWCGSLKSKYGQFNDLPYENLHSSSLSLWWRDIMNLDAKISIQQGWFYNNVRLRVENVVTTRFWTHRWLGENTMKDFFPHLFSISKDKERLIADMRSWEAWHWRWSWRWRRALFVWKEELLSHMEVLVKDFVTRENMEDTWVWLDDVDTFPVASTYKKLEMIYYGGPQQQQQQASWYKLFWSYKIPSKVLTFSWRLLQQRISTRDQLQRRGLNINIDNSCVFCNEAMEDCHHLFSSCRVMDDI